MGKLGGNRERNRETAIWSREYSILQRFVAEVVYGLLSASISPDGFCIALHYKQRASDD